MLILRHSSNVASHAAFLALFLPVRPELLFHPFNEVHNVSAVLVQMFLLRKRQRNVKELDQVAKLKKRLYETCKLNKLVSRNIQFIICILSPFRVSFHNCGGGRPSFPKV